MFSLCVSLGAHVFTGMLGFVSLLHALPSLHMLPCVTVCVSNALHEHFLTCIDAPACWLLCHLWFFDACVVVLYVLRMQACAESAWPVGDACAL